MIKQLKRLFLFIGLSIIGTANGEVLHSMHVLEKNKALVTRYFEQAWNEGRLEVLDDIISSDYINHSPGFENPKPGPEGLKPIVSAIRQGFPDLKYIIKKLVVAEDHVAAHVVMTGTHTGEFFGIPATGKQIEVPQMQIERIVNGKIREHWRVTDDFSMIKQLGLDKGGE